MIKKTSNMDLDMTSSYSKITSPPPFQLQFYCTAITKCPLSVYVSKEMINILASPVSLLQKTLQKNITTFKKTNTLHTHIEPNFWLSNSIHLRGDTYPSVGGCVCIHLVTCPVTWATLSLLKIQYV
jgi:hypothetical protein